MVIVRNLRKSFTEALTGLALVAQLPPSFYAGELPAATNSAVFSHSYAALPTDATCAVTFIDTSGKPNTLSVQGLDAKGNKIGTFTADISAGKVQNYSLNESFSSDLAAITAQSPEQTVSKLTCEKTVNTLLPDWMKKFGYQESNAKSTSRFIIPSDEFLNGKQYSFPMIAGWQHQFHVGYLGTQDAAMLTLGTEKNPKATRNRIGQNESQTLSLESAVGANTIGTIGQVSIQQPNTGLTAFETISSSTITTALTPANSALNLYFPHFFKNDPYWTSAYSFQNNGTDEAIVFLEGYANNHCCPRR